MYHFASGKEFENLVGVKTKSQIKKYSSTEVTKVLISENVKNTTFKEASRSAENYFQTNYNTKFNGVGLRKTIYHLKGSEVDGTLFNNW